MQQQIIRKIIIFFQVNHKIILYNYFTQDVEIKSYHSYVSKNIIPIPFTFMTKYIIKHISHL